MNGSGDRCIGRAACGDGERLAAALWRSASSAALAARLRSRSCDDRAELGREDDGDLDDEMSMASDWVDPGRRTSRGLAGEGVLEGSRKAVPSASILMGDKDRREGVDAGAAGAGWTLLTQSGRP